MIAKQICEVSTIDTNLKLCEYCNQTYPLDNFSRNRDTSSGYSTYCKQCMSIMQRENYQRWKQRKMGIDPGDIVVPADTGNDYSAYGIRDIKDIALMVVRDGMTITDVANKEGINVETVRRYIKSAGYTYNLKAKKGKRWVLRT